MTLEASINHLLSSVLDPVLGLHAVDMGLRYHFTCQGNQLTLDLIAGFPVEALQKTYVPFLTAALQATLPQYHSTVLLTASIKAHKTQLTGMALCGVKNTIAIASGKGGVGKSTITVNLAMALAKMGARVGILDADIYGPSIPLMLGDTAPIAVQDDKYIPASTHGLSAMSIGYLTDPEQALIWRGPMLAKSLLQMLNLTLWDDLDYLFIDLPPGTGDIQLSLVQKIPLTAAIVVTTPQQVATLDAQKAIDLFTKTQITVLGVIENMSMHICTVCNHQEPLFGEGGAMALCTKNQCTLLGQLPLNRVIQEQCDTGIPSPELLQPIFNKPALQLAIQLAQKPLNYAHKIPNVVVE